MDLDEVTGELYSVPPEEFIVLRKTRQDEAKADGDKALATEIGALRRPSAAAWVCNLLVREQRAAIEGLVDLGNLLREAQANLAGDQLRALDVQRRQLLTALTRQARALANARTHPVSTSVVTQIEETLRAGMSDPEAGQTLLTGRLTAPMSYSGLGTTAARPDLRLVHPPRSVSTEGPAKAAARTKQTQESAADRRMREQEEQQRAAEEERQRELDLAREAATVSVALAEEAAAAVEQLRREVEDLGVRRMELQDRLAELAEQLADGERAAGEAAGTLGRSQRRLTAVEHDHAEAVQARDRALAHAAVLADG